MVLVWSCGVGVGEWCGDLLMLEMFESSQNTPNPCRLEFEEVGGLCGEEVGKTKVDFMASESGTGRLQW